MRFWLNFIKSLWGWALVIILIGSGAYIFSMESKGGQGADSMTILPPPKIPYSLIIRGIVNIKGGIINISAPRTGTFSEIYVKEGEYVEKGQLLAVQDDRDDEIKIRSAEIAIENAFIQKKFDELNLNIQNRELTRAKLQFDQGAISEQTYDNAKDQFERAKLTVEKNKSSLDGLLTNLETAKINLAQRQITSPVDGQILTISVNAGIGVSADNVSTAFQIIPKAPKYIRLKLDDSNIDKVFIGQDVVISRENNSQQTYEGRVSHIGNVFASILSDNQGGNTVDVIVDVDTLPFRLGQTVLAKFKNQKPSVSNDAAQK